MFIHWLFSFLFAAFVCVWLSLVGALDRAHAQAKTNPVPSDPASIAAGKKLYDNNCVECHGEAGKGDGPRAEYSNPTPPDLTDGEWKHGSTDGDLFKVIQDGVTDTDMQSFKEDLSEQDTWNVLNYVKSLGPKK